VDEELVRTSTAKMKALPTEGVWTLAAGVD
jgi:hypothetical protein